jgi:membrane protease YdiL (CAAX protease family)
LNKNKIYLLSYILLIGLSLIYTNKYTIIIPPLILVILIFYLYKDDIINYNYKELLSNERISNWIFYSIIIIIVSQTAINLIMSSLFHSALHTTSQSIMFIPTTPLFAVIFAPIIEELAFRRIIFKWLNTKLNFWLSASISSIIFAAGHGSLVGLLGYIVVGMIFCWVYKRTNNIGIVMVTHGFVNFFVIFITALKMNINI